MNEIAPMQIDQLEHGRQRSFKICLIVFAVIVLLSIAFPGLLWLMSNGYFDKWATFENYVSNDGTYTVRTRSEDFVKLVDGKNGDSRNPTEGILIVRRLDKTWDPEWTPVCYHNFNDYPQACKDLGFPNGSLGYYRTNVEAVNGGEWEVSDGWRQSWEYGKHPYTEINTENQPKFYRDKPRSILTHGRDVSNVRNCNEDKPIVWLVCDAGLTSDPRTITEIGLNPTG